jgi:uncharacterized membrane protein
MSFVVIFFVALSLFLALAPLAFAQNGNETGTVPTGFEPIYEVFKTLGYAAPIAVLIGLVTCMIGYLKSTPPEEFKLVEFIYTFLISLIIGIATIYGGWTYAQISEWLANGCLSVWLYWIAKIIAKKLSWIPQATGPPATA